MSWRWVGLGDEGLDLGLSGQCRQTGVLVSLWGPQPWPGQATRGHDGSGDCDSLGSGESGAAP